MSDTTTTQGNATATTTEVASNNWTEQGELTPQVHTAQEIWKWTLSKDAIAPCFVRDVFSMTSGGVKDADFFWLGRVPCRNVRILGLVVGIQPYEKRIIYSVDDGTSVIDCFHPVPVPPKKPTTSNHPLEPPTTPEPIAHVGSLVCVVGRVTGWHNSRQIKVEQIQRCIFFNEEPSHWRTVLSLHASSYSLSDPFIIPPLSQQETVTQDQPPHNQQVHTNTIAGSPAPSSCTSVGTTPASSPSKSTCSHNSPPRLRHPSRLHSRDLTGNAFRIYIKHYMDNAKQATWESNSETDSFFLSGSLIKRPVTPTKGLRQISDNTPRPSNAATVKTDNTPRPRIGACSFIPSNHNATNHPPRQDVIASNLHGFTLSYLRRVPELADMARRVVQAEAKRRERAERRQAKEDGLNVKRPESKAVMSKEKIAPKMKRLFEWAIIKLFEEGSIVLWDGPVRACAERGFDNMSGLWKSYASTSTSAGPDSTVFSSISNIDVGGEDEIMLSDPEPQEEAYVSMTPKYLAGYVEKAIATLVSRPLKQRRRRSLSSAASRGPSQGEITLFLRRSDVRWKNLGGWAVDGALDVLKEEGRALDVGGGRWALCL